MEPGGQSPRRICSRRAEARSWYLSGIELTSLICMVCLAASIADLSFRDKRFPWDWKKIGVIGKKLQVKYTEFTWSSHIVCAISQQKSLSTAFLPLQHSDADSASENDFVRDIWNYSHYFLGFVLPLIDFLQNLYCPTIQKSACNHNNSWQSHCLGLILFIG